MQPLDLSEEVKFSDPDALYAAKLLSQLFSTPSESSEGIPSIEAQTQCGRFQIKQILGRGAFGTVFEAFDPVMGRSVAIKLAHERVCFDESLRNRFFREIQLASKLNHPGIVRLYDAGEVDGRLYFTMEVCRGETLAKWLSVKSELRASNEAALVVKKIAEAIQFGHIHGVIHRDLKPDNIVVDCDENEGLNVRVLDFGLASGIEDALRNTTTSVMLGTPLYMSPEQVDGDSQRIGPASDIFSLGTILYECLTGVPPFFAETLPRVIDRLRSGVCEPVRKLNASAAIDLETICMKCLSQEPSDRYLSAGDLACDLEAFLNDRSISAKPISWWRSYSDSMRQPARFKEWGLGLIAVNLLVLGWSTLNYPMAMLLFPKAPSDQVDHEMFLPMVLLIIPIHSLLLWSSSQIYRRRLRRSWGMVHLLVTLTMGIVAIAVICLVPSTKTMEISRFQRVGALGLISTFAEVQAALVLGLLCFGKWGTSCKK